MYRAAVLGDLDTVRSMINTTNVDISYRGETCMSMFISLGNLEGVKLCIENGASINDVPQYFPGAHGTYICASVRLMDIDITRVLLEAGANPNRNHIEDGKEYKALDMLPKYRSEKHMTVMLHLLLDYGARFDLMERKRKIRCAPKVVAARKRAREAARIVMGIKRIHRLAPLVQADVLKLIAKHIWSTRTDSGWEPETKK